MVVEDHRGADGVECLRYARNMLSRTLYQRSDLAR
jgi:hypothetical protein